MREYAKIIGVNDASCDALKGGKNLYGKRAKRLL